MYLQLAWQRVGDGRMGDDTLLTYFVLIRAAAASAEPTATMPGPGSTSSQP